MCRVQNMNNVVITYRYGNPNYLELIGMVIENISTCGYKPFVVGDCGFADAIDIHYENNSPLMVWILEAQKAYMESKYFTKDSILFSPDALIIKPIEFPKCDLGVTLNYLQPVKHLLNNGVIFIKPRHKDKLIKLWDDAIRICKSYPQGIQEWGGDQMALQEALVTSDWEPYGLKVKLLNCEDYNAPMTKNNPTEDERVLKKAKIIHFKGERKRKMAQIWRDLKGNMYG